MKKIFMSFAIISLLAGCKKNSSEPGQALYTSSNKSAITAAARLELGDAYAGGIIFYFSDNTHTHGRVCATRDVGQYAWDLTIFDPQNPQNYNPPYVGGTGTSLVLGAANTSGITLALGAGNYAAYMCRSYRGYGYNDWSLPSKDELNLIYQRLKHNGLSSFNSANSSYYWTSSEIDNKAVWCQRLDDGAQVDYAWKNNIMNVRATRGF